MRINVPLALTLTLLTTHASAQDCATVLDAESALLALDLHRAGAYTGAPEHGDLHIPLAVHIVRKADRSGGMPLPQLDTALEDLAERFEPAGIHFYVAAPIDYIDDDFFHSGMTTIEDIDALRSTNVADGAVNVYFTGQFSTNIGSMCGISSFTVSPVQGVVLSSACAGVSHNRSTFSHELGHYFDLYHTHEIMFGHECTSGAACQSTGDLVCDTPADPTLGYHNVNGGCNFVGIQVDPCTGLRNYNPDVLNVMSSSPRMCRTRFSDGQIDRMRATITNLRPELLEHCPVDMDFNGSLGLGDFLAFQDMMMMGEPGADLDADNHLTIMDVLTFQDVFMAGCR